MRYRIAALALSCCAFTASAAEWSGTLVDVMVPTTHICESDFDSQVSLDQLRQLFHRSAQLPTRIVRARHRRVLVRI